jgi:hypothetical protein
MLSIAERIVSRQITEALTRHQVAPTSRIRTEIEARIDWSTVSASSASIRADAGRILPLDAYVDELRHDPRYSQDFPPEPQQISRGDTDKLREHFDEIRAGTTIVVD